MMSNSVLSTLAKKGFKSMTHLSVLKVNFSGCRNLGTDGIKDFCADGISK